LSYKPLNKPNKKDSAILQHLLSKLESQLDSELESEEQTLETHVLDHALSNIKHVPEDFLNVITQITAKKVFNKNYFSFQKTTNLKLLPCLIHVLI
jgi:hypothetical protein